MIAPWEETGVTTNADNKSNIVNIPSILRKPTFGKKKKKGFRVGLFLSKRFHKKEESNKSSVLDHGVLVSNGSISSSTSSSSSNTSSSTPCDRKIRWNEEVIVYCNE